MEDLLPGKKKEELGYTDNKEIPIASIYGINIKRFRTIEQQELRLGSQVTILSGRNGTMKTSLMGLIAHPFDSVARDAFGKPLKTQLKEVFKLSPEYDDEKYEYDLILKTPDGGLLHEPVSMYYVAHKTKRHRVVVSGAEKGDGNFTYNTSFLNLKRLYPMVDTDAKPDTTKKITLTTAESRDLKDFYETVFPSSEYDQFIPVRAAFNLKTTFGPSGASATYDWQAISSGEDNLGAIFNRLLGFQRSHEKQQPEGNGILCIDEFESSLHPVAQLRLFDYLYRWSCTYKVQVVISTHSLHLISHVYLRHSANLETDRVIINFISKSSAHDNNYPILHNPPYDLAYKELTFEDPTAAAEARKIKVFCEDDVAIHFVKKLIKKQNILRAVEFHSSLNPASENPGTSYSALSNLCIQFPLLLERSIVIFDGDVTTSITNKIKNKNLYLVLPDKDGLAIERRIIAYITSLNNSDEFFTKFRKEKDVFLDSFKQAGIRSLTLGDIINEQTTSIERCKTWARKNMPSFKQYITYYCNNLADREEFSDQFSAAIDKINAAAGLPKIQES